MEVPLRWRMIVRAPLWIEDILNDSPEPLIGFDRGFDFESSIPEAIRKRLNFRQMADWSHRVSRYAEFELERTLERAK